MQMVEPALKSLQVLHIHADVMSHLDRNILKANFVKLLDLVEMPRSTQKSFVDERCRQLFRGHPHFDLEFDDNN
jgi:hypothetical protein